MFSDGVGRSGWLAWLTRGGQTGYRQLDQAMPRSFFMALYQSLNQPVLTLL
jgi:hypothetical protein